MFVSIRHHPVLNGYASIVRVWISETKYYEFMFPWSRFLYSNLFEIMFACRDNPSMWDEILGDIAQFSFELVEGDRNKLFEGETLFELYPMDVGLSVCQYTTSQTVVVDCEASAIGWVLHTIFDRVDDYEDVFKSSGTHCEVKQVSA